MRPTEAEYSDGRSVNVNIFIHGIGVAVYVPVSGLFAEKDEQMLRVFVLFRDSDSRSWFSLCLSVTIL